MIKLEPTEQPISCPVANTTAIFASTAPLNPSKRMRKVPCLSRRLRTAAQIYPPTQLLEATHVQLKDQSTAADDDLSQDHHRHSPSQPFPKRPRLTYSKRLVANARERERVHHLTAAFEALRRVLPMYGDQEKLSRLSILRIACSYVLVLGALNQIDFSQGQNAYTLNETFHMLSYTILNELKRKKLN